MCVCVCVCVYVHIYDMVRGNKNIIKLNILIKTNPYLEVSFDNESHPWPKSSGQRLMLNGVGANSGMHAASKGVTPARVISMRPAPSYKQKTGPPRTFRMIIRAYSHYSAVLFVSP